MINNKYLRIINIMYNCKYQNANKKYKTSNLKFLLENKRKSYLKL